MKNLKVLSLVILIFAAGFISGVVATRFVVRRFVQTAVARPEVIRGRVEKDLLSQLQLTPPQREQMRKVLREYHERQRELRAEFQPRFNAIMLETRSNISAVLTAEQQQTFERFLERNRAFLALREPPAPRTNPPTGSAR